NTDVLKIIDNEDDQNQDFEQIELQIGSENIGTAAFEVSRLLLDKSDDSEEIIDENKITNSLTKFPDLQYILNQKPIPQRQFEKFNLFFIPEGFLCSKYEGNTGIDSTIPVGNILSLEPCQCCSC
ncbi:14323_t:CDS:2, partial [Funneliformis caledonium]